jgi:hypothetical protein
VNESQMNFGTGRIGSAGWGSQRRPPRTVMFRFVCGLVPEATESVQRPYHGAHPARISFPWVLHVVTYVRNRGGRQQ